MAIKKKFRDKYAEGIKLMKAIGMDDEDIEDKLDQAETLEGWEAVTLEQLQKMSQDELNQILSYTWKYGRWRCDSIGISNLKIEKRQSDSSKYWNVSWSDDAGDPEMEVHSLKAKLNNNNDKETEWAYGLFRKKRK